jgi:hypothetical protein
MEPGQMVYAAEADIVAVTRINAARIAQSDNELQFSELLPPRFFSRFAPSE